MNAQCRFLINRLAEKRLVIESLISKAPTDKEIFTGWKLKELLAHMSGWDDVVIEALLAHAADEPIGTSVTTGIDTYNAKTVTTREALDLEHVIQEWKATRQALVQTLTDLPDDKFNQPLTFPWGEQGTVAYLVEIFVEHEEHHAAQLAEWLEDTEAVIGAH